MQFSTTDVLFYAVGLKGLYVPILEHPIRITRYWRTAGQGASLLGLTKDDATASGK